MGVDILTVLARLGADLPTVIVEPFLGEGPFGPTFGPPVSVPCWRDDTRRLVRGKDGSEVVSSTALAMRTSVTCPVGSRVALAPGTAAERVTTVISVATGGAAGLPLPEHLEVHLL